MMLKTQMTDAEKIETTMVRMLAQCPPGKTVEPSAIARAVSGPHVEEWGPLMQPLRRVAVRLAKEGRVVIYRKGRPADPDDFKGTYKLGPVRLD